MLKKVSRKNVEDRAPDVPADNPEGTMERFTTGLKRVLSAHKVPPEPARGIRKTARTSVRRRV